MAAAQASHTFPGCPLGSCTAPRPQPHARLHPTPSSNLLSPFPFTAPPPTSHARPSESSCELLLIQRGAREIFFGEFSWGRACLAPGWGWAEPHAVRGVDRAAASQAGVLAPRAEIRRWDRVHAVDKGSEKTWGLQKRQGDPEMGFGS